jgi:hypothetical protein
MAWLAWRAELSDMDHVCKVQHARLKRRRGRPADVSSKCVFLGCGTEPPLGPITRGRVVQLFLMHGGPLSRYRCTIVASPVLRPCMRYMRYMPATVSDIEMSFSKRGQIPRHDLCPKVGLAVALAHANANAWGLQLAECMAMLHPVESGALPCMCVV